MLDRINDLVLSGLAYVYKIGYFNKGSAIFTVEKSGITGIRPRFAQWPSYAFFAYQANAVSGFEFVALCFITIRVLVI